MSLLTGDENFRGRERRLVAVRGRDAEGAGRGVWTSRATWVILVVMGEVCMFTMMSTLFTVFYYSFGIVGGGKGNQGGRERIYVGVDTCYGSMYSMVS